MKVVNHSLLVPACTKPILLKPCLVVRLDYLKTEPIVIIIEKVIFPKNLCILLQIGVGLCESVNTSNRKLQLACIKIGMNSLCYR